MRPPTEDDLARVAALASEHAPDPVDQATVRLEWSSPRVDLERDARVEDDAYALVERLDGERAWIGLHGRPSRDLFDWAESHAAQLGSRVLSGTWSGNTPILSELERRGFRLVRHSHRMVIDLADATAEPAFPEGVAVRTFEPGDERVFYDVHQEAFADSWEPVEEPYEEWAHWLLVPPTFAPDLWFLAEANGDPTGVAICHPHRSRPTWGWVRILAVRRPWRRRGIGRALLLHAFREFRRRGLASAGLGVDAESLTGANRLYEQVGMRVASRFDIYEKEFR